MLKPVSTRPRTWRCSVSSSNYAAIGLSLARQWALTGSCPPAGPLPRFDGMPVEVPSSPRDPGTTAGATSPPPGAPIRVPPLNPEDVNKFTSLFEKSGVQGGVMPGTRLRASTYGPFDKLTAFLGETAKQIFERARLPNETLGRIWNLADTKQRGALDATEFIIAMHLLTSFRSGAMRGIPQTLPPGLYDAAARKGVSRSSTGPRPGMDVPPVPAIPREFSGPQRTESPINRQQFGSPVMAQHTGGDWLVTPQEKTHFDSIFATVDTAKAGMISGDQAVSFFMNAQLPEETLAQIWDLADIDADGQLTKDEFAVAMYLVRQQRGGKEPLPQTLPPALIPPSMRRQAPGEAVAASTAPAPAPQPAAAPAPAQRSAAEDLFGLDSFNAPPPAAPSQVPQSTGSSSAAFQAPGSPTSKSPPSPSTSTTFKPFVPTSSFGQSLQPQVTGSASTTPAAAGSPPPSDDLLGDNDPEESKKLTNETTELANLSNQIGSLANEMHNVQGKRTSAEQNLSQTSQQKRDFESRLAQARTMYEEEVKNFKALEERLHTSKSETTKLQQEYALLDGSRQDLQNQYDQVSAALTADQQENASLKEKIRQANAAVSQLKPALEKARLDARQQKGLTAINKKQLATVEGERDKMQEEMGSPSKELPEAEESPAAPEARATSVSSAGASAASQHTNPFFKRTATGTSDSALSPQVSNDQKQAFESVFGPSFGPPSTATPPPPTSFRSESPTVPLQPPSKSPATSGAPTPSVSPPPSHLGSGSEPPAPSQSRQMTPSALPLGEVQSATSSTRVSPAGSRVGGPDAATVDTPSQAVTSELPPGRPEEEHISPTTTREHTAQSPFDEVHESSARFPELPGSAEGTEKAAPPAGDEKHAKDPSFDELFGGPARERSHSQKANDFDEAFSTMKPPFESNKTNGTPHAAESEFPPIREIDHGDDDDSTDEEAPMGFDDNFTPVAPTQSRGEAKTSSIDSSHLAAFPAPGNATAGQPVASPPAAESQISPPKYEENAPGQSQGDLPPEFNGLVPNRSDPTTSPDAPHSIESSTGAPMVGGEPQHEAKDAPTAVGQPKNGKPDFEAEFAGLDLAPAKEAEDEDDEDTHKKDTTDFDFSFDAPSQQKPDPSISQGGSGFFDFDSNVRTPSAEAPAQPSTTSNDKPAAHDWDALFAPLDNPSVPGGWPNGGAGQPEPSKTEAGDTREPGWALKTDTGEDDQTLQRLTGMGFPRDDSLDALEKSDYNLDKVC